MKPSPNTLRNRRMTKEELKQKAIEYILSKDNELIQRYEGSTLEIANSFIRDFLEQSFGIEL
jgi:hypothetical protein